jgi:hypothetical protein
MPKQAGILDPARIPICAPGHFCRRASNVRYRTEGAQCGAHNPRMVTTKSWAEQLESLSGCGDTQSLRHAIQGLCAEFGKVMHIDVFTIAEEKRRRALCLLRLESAAQEQKLMQTLRAERFGDDVLIVVDLHSNPQ